VATIDLPSESGGPARVTPPPTVDAAGALLTLPGITHTAELGGYTRSWNVVAPAIAETTRPRPLVILLHGLAADGTILQQALGFDPLADGTDVVLAYPDAIDGAWNDERVDATSSTAHQSHIDDVAFLDHIIDDAVAADRVDPNRVAVVGFSNGGMMAAYYACVRADRVRAIAVVAGAGGAGLNARCNPTRPVSVLAIHSRRDRVVPFQGGPIAADTGHWGSSAPVPLMLDRWRTIAGCQGIVDRVYTSAAPVVTEQHAYGCRPGVEVVLERVESKVHGWLSDPTFMTTDIVWQFVVEHTLVPA
jgi:polyhydroxybutyrate depolymerase